MTFAPLADAPLHIQIHVAAAMLALLLGPVALYRSRRDVVHKIVGYTWIAAMAVTALSSFWITEFGLIGPLSPIHALSLFALWSLWEGLRHARRRDLRRHAATLRSLYWNGLLVAASFTFLPGRRLNRMLFDDMRGMGYVVIAAAVTVIVAHALWRRHRSAPAARPA